MTEEGWTNGAARSLMVFLNGCAISERDERGARIADSSFLLLFNASDQPVDFALTGWGPPLEWRQCVDSRLAGPPASDAALADDHMALEGRTIVILTSTGLEPHSDASDG
jgi:glycogen operon protein